MNNNIRFWTGSKINKPIPVVHDNVILCVGTNTQGRSGKGLALLARNYWGAKYGQSRGLSGRCYLLVTKNLKKGFFEKETGITYERYGRFSLTKKQIRDNIEEMYNVARAHPDKSFIIPYINGKSNLNGYSSLELITLFIKDINVPRNIVFHNSWREIITSMTSEDNL